VVTKIYISLDIIPCSLLNTKRCFAAKLASCLLQAALLLDYSSTLNTKLTFSSENLANFQRTTLHYIPEYRNVNFAFCFVLFHFNFILIHVDFFLVYRFLPLTLYFCPFTKSPVSLFLPHFIISYPTQRICSILILFVFSFALSVGLLFLS
jgi:hypothetical protein